MRILLRFFFYLLYHPLAFAYDLVAATVSLGRWKNWVLSVAPFIKGNRILEMGHGPGHLQRFLLERNLPALERVFAVGIDESASMGRLAQRNLRRFLGSNPNNSKSQSHPHAQPNQRRAYTQVNLTRGLAQQLPFPDESFDTIVATFPSEYVTKAETLAEVKRCLADGGRFVVLPVAMLMGRGILDRLMALVFRVTGQVPQDPIHVFTEKFKLPFVEAGFQVEIKGLDVKSSLLLVVIATKPN